MFATLLRGVAKGAGRIFVYQMARAARCLTPTVGRLVTTGARGVTYRGVGIAGTAAGKAAKAAGKTVTSRFLPNEDEKIAQAY